MRKRRNFRKRPKDNAQGLSVTVYNNNVEEALKRFKRKVKNSDIMQDLRKKEYFVKKSVLKRERKNLAKLRNGSIITGQQPIIIGGPGYIANKLSTLIKFDDEFQKRKHHLSPIFSMIKHQRKN